MLLTARALKDLSFGALMCVYEESNRENAEDFWPDLSEGQQILRAEQEFYQYLREVFFRTSGAVYCIWKSGDAYVSALRLEPYRDGLLLEALETCPASRRRGYAEALLREVLAQFDDCPIYSHVHKSNVPSLSIHEKCGFQRILEHAVYVDGSVNQRCCTFVYHNEKSKVR